MTLLENGLPKVSGMDDLAGKTVIDVGGWAPTADGLGFVTNKCTNQPYSQDFTLVIGPENDDAMKMLRNGTGDAVFLYADQANNYQCAGSDVTAEWDCSLWQGFGTEYAYVQTGQKGWAINGTTLAMTKPGSTVPELINSCLADFLQTKEYYDICVKHGFVGFCYPNSHFPSGASDKPNHDKPTNELAGDCSDGYCPCDSPAASTTGSPASQTSGAIESSFRSLAWLLAMFISFLN